jgi:hypothetical protein
MMAETIKVEGLRELGLAFKELSDDIQKKVARATTNAGAQVIKKLAAQKAPVADADYVVRNRKGDPGVLVPRGNLPKKISVKYLGKQTNLTSEHIVFVKGKRKDGYANRIGPALEQGKDAAITAMKNRLKQRIDKANKK